MKSTLRDDNPVIFVEHKALYNIKGHVPEEECLVPFGQAVVRRPGEHVTVVALGQMVHRAMQAAARLEREGISVEIIDPRTLAPFDKDTILTSVAKTGRLVIVDEAYASCGVSAEIVAIVAGEALYELDAPILRICTLAAPHAFSPSLDNYLVPSVDRIVSEVAALAGKKL
jgi:acetoin:2,6-dichlorophenolindophenol oxidoreductase subunit beta